MREKISEEEALKLREKHAGGFFMFIPPGDIKIYTYPLPQREMKLCFIAYGMYGEEYFVEVE